MGASKNRPVLIKWIFTRGVSQQFNTLKIHLSEYTEFCPSLCRLCLTDGVVGAYVQFDLNQTLSQFLHWHDFSSSQICALAVRNSIGEGATLWKNDEGQNLETHSWKVANKLSLLFAFCSSPASPSACCFCAQEISDAIFTFSWARECSFHTERETFSPIACFWPPLSLNVLW